MTAVEIRQAVDDGKVVYWKNLGYQVKKYEGTTLDPETMEIIPDFRYEIVCLSNEHMIGLTWTDGVTLNGKEEDFHIEGEE